MTSALRLVTQKISVAIIKDDAITREGVAALLSQDGEFVVVASGSEISATKLGDAQPDIFLVDAQLLEGDDARLAPALAQAASGAKIIATGLSADHKGLVGLVRAGVSGFVVKDASYAELAQTIRSVAAGVQVMPPSLITTLFRNVAQEGDQQEHVTSSALERMTPREREISLLIAEGRSNKEIAVKSHISTNTVKCHVRNIMEKLALHTRLQIAAKANAEHWSQRVVRDQPMAARPMLRSVPMGSYASF